MKKYFLLIFCAAALYGQSFNSEISGERKNNNVVYEKMSVLASAQLQDKESFIRSRAAQAKVLGANWSFQRADTISWWYVKAVDTNTVWACGYSAITNGAGRGYVSLSTNRGTTWINASGTLANLNAAITCIMPISSTTAWAGDETGKIYYTSNQGATWTTQSTGQANWINDIIYIGANTLLAVSDPLTQGGQFLFLRTTNGSTWSQVFSSSASRSDSLEWCLNRASGIFGLYIYVGTNLRSILRSTDQGLTWSVLSTQPSVSPLSFAMRTITTGIITGSYGYVAKLSGTTLSTVTPFETGSIRTSQWIASASKYVAGGFNGFFSSTDLGTTWTKDAEVFPTAINYLTFPSSTVGWVCGQGMISRFDSYNAASSPSITSFTPSSGAVGSSVTITGTNFGATQGASSVRFGTTTASIVSWSNTSITATVPSLSAGGYTISVQTANGTASSSSQFTVSSITLSAPSIGPPANGSMQLTSVTLSWTTVSAATSYDIEYGANIGGTFTGKTVNTISNSYSLINLAQGTTYLWRVRAKNANGISNWSSQFSFTTTSTVTAVLQSVVSFPSTPKNSTDYRLFTYPDNNSPEVNTIVSGETPKDFRLFSDNGGTVPSHLDELKADDKFKVGEGFWLIKKGNLDINQSIVLKPFATSTNYVNISVRTNKWNIIGSPFLTSVKWSDVVAANSLTSGSVIYSYDGSFSVATTLDPFAGYYYFGNNLSSLRIPYPFTSPPENLPKQNSTLTKIGIQYTSPINKDYSAFVGIDEKSQIGFDEYETRKPPVFSDQGSVWFNKPEWDEVHSRFASDIRPALGEGQQWNFVVHHPFKEKGQLQFSGLENLSPEYSAVLIDNETKSMTKVSTNLPIAIYPSKVEKNYSLLIGKRAFIESKKEKYIPEEFQLMQNYPNPFNPGTIIQYQIPHNPPLQGGSREAAGGFVTLEIYDALGREVTTLVNEVKEPGYYSVYFDASRFSSGVYFAKLTMGDKVQLKKLILTK